MRRGGRGRCHGAHQRQQGAAEGRIRLGDGDVHGRVVFSDEDGARAMRRQLRGREWRGGVRRRCGCLL
jgi:hypothetical protein